MIGILRHDIDRVVSVRFVNFDSKQRTNPIPLQEEHDIPNGFMLLPRGFNVDEFLLSDARNMEKFLNVLFKYFQCSFFEVLNNFSRGLWPDALDQTRS